jgi:prefoldin subunit 5
MSSVDDMPAGSGDNPDLEAMHRNLVALVRRLEESIDSAPDAPAIAAITEQMAEVNARVTSTGRAQTEEIARYAQAVSNAIPAIEKEIETLQNCERMVRSVAALLGIVDEAVRIATLACG